MVVCFICEKEIGIHFQIINEKYVCEDGICEESCIECKKKDIQIKALKNLAYAEIVGQKDITFLDLWVKLPTDVKMEMFNKIGYRWS